MHYYTVKLHSPFTEAVGNTAVGLVRGSTATPQEIRTKTFLPVQPVRTLQPHLRYSKAGIASFNVEYPGMYITYIHTYTHTYLAYASAASLHEAG